MELNDNAVVCTDSINPQTGEGSAGEIELYDELIAFAELPAEEQVRVQSSPEPSSEPWEQSDDDARDCTFSEPVLTGAPAESLTSVSDWTGSPTQSVESVTNATAAEPGCDSEVLNEPIDTIDAGPSAVHRLSPSGPLSGFGLPRELVYTGAMSRGVCLACGAESGADDLFCLSCGDFVDEVASTVPSNPTCGECKQPIDLEEIFCPWCGSAMPAQR